ncbi:IS5/IS1182 family transposase, partial [Magnetococcus sp. PR-3]
GITPTIKKELKRRNAIEPIIGHLKSEGRLDRNFLRGVLGDQLNVLISGIGYNLRLILKKLRLLWLLFWIQTFRPPQESALEPANQTGFERSTF